jgi:hypothetical protein
MPLEGAVEALQKLKSGEANFRMALTMGQPLGRRMSRALSKFPCPHVALGMKDACEGLSVPELGK